MYSLGLLPFNSRDTAFAGLCRFTALLPLPVSYLSFTSPSTMQFHLNGFKGSRDPLQLLHTGEQEPDFQSSLPEEVDVLIIGAGPAGQLLGTQLSRFPNITTRIIESKPARLEQGQALNSQLDRFPEHRGPITLTLSEPSVYRLS
ncbi:hypothetical protein LTR59_007797 [Friedmanniomyces endolithicus]|nr:hypothetical protein LTR94_007149 [Friedmanniomyces endolithicus]KAK0779362.1 hypothetical protein LTR38_014462 [Friedmanniomyces endolithicus]KAK0794378.1 hypothetical protein LTR59_007797 [Friedmanniomyces endolithicus]